MANYSIPSLAAADYGIGQLVLESLKALNAQDNSCLSGLNGRSSKDFIYRMPEQDDLSTLLRELSSSQHARIKLLEGLSNTKGTHSRLPFMAYSRLRGLTTLSADQAVNAQGITVMDEGAMQHYKVNVTWMELNYAVYAVASDRDAVEALMMVWHFYVSQNNKSHHHIPMDFKISGQEFTTHGYIQDPKTLNSIDISVTEKKLFGLRADYIVHAPCIYGHTVDVPQAVRVAFTLLPVNE